MAQPGGVCVPLSSLRGPGVGYQSLPTFSAIFIMNFQVQLPIPHNLSRTIYDTPPPQHTITGVCCGTRRGYVRRYSHFHLTRKIYTEHRKKTNPHTILFCLGPLSVKFAVKNKESRCDSRVTKRFDAMTLGNHQSEGRTKKKEYQHYTALEHKPQTFNTSLSKLRPSSVKS